MRIKDVIRLIVGLAPASRAKNRLLRALGWRVAPSARIGSVILYRVDRLVLDDGARVGPLNVFRDMKEVRLGAQAIIGQFNWISSAPSLVEAGGLGTLAIGQHSAITSRHYLDCSGGISVGEYTTVAGVRSTFITHGIDWRTNHQRTRPIAVGNRCLISSNVSFPPGTVVADGVVVGMGATLPRSIDEANALYLAPRAGVAKQDLSGKYFTRLVGAVEPSAPEKRE